MKNLTIKVRIDSGKLSDILEELKTHLTELPAEIIKFLFHLFNSPAEFVSFEERPAEGAIEIALEPKDLLLDLLVAVRTRDFDSFLVKHSHDLPPLVDENNDSTETENSKI